MSNSPYTMNIKDAAKHFGYTETALRLKMHKGQLIFGKHFIKDGRKVLIVVDAFKEMLYENCGLDYGSIKN